MAAPQDDQHAARIEEERKRVAILDDTIAAQLANILIAGSVGVIVASVTFLKDIAPQPVTGSLLYVRIAWVALFLASATSIASLLTSRKAGKAYRDWLAAIADKQDASELESRCRGWNSWSKRLQIFGMVCLTGGAALLLWFANLNLPSERDPMSDKDKKVQTGVPDTASKLPDTTSKSREKPQPEPRERPTHPREKPTQPGKPGEKAYDFDTTNPFLKPPSDKPDKK